MRGYSEIAQRRLHSIATLAVKTGIERRRSSRLLRKIGKVPEGATDAESGVLVVPAGGMGKPCDDLEDAVSLADVASSVSRPKSQVAALRGAGILMPIGPPDGPGSVRRIVFARRHLGDVLDRLAAPPELRSEDVEAYRSMVEACRVGAARTADVIASARPGRSMRRGNRDRSGSTGSWCPSRAGRLRQDSEKPDCDRS